MKLIDKDALVAEIEKLRKKNDAYDKPSHISDVCYEEILSLIDTIEVKDVDLDNHTIMEEIRKCGCNPSEFDVAKHFFELGLKENQENNVIGTFEREVKIDASGYPYIDCDFEFYGYEPGIPLAKKGDKIKIVVAKGE